MTVSSDDPQDTFSKSQKKLSPDGLSVRFSVIGILSLLMLIPLFMVSNVINDRNQYYHQIMTDIASLWGGEQIISGPMLLIPYVEKYITRQTETSDSGKDKILEKVNYINQVAIILPEKLNISTDLKEEFRKRGIYKSLVYNATSEITGQFNIPDFSHISEDVDRIEWQKAHIVMGLKDTSAIKQLSRINWNDTTANFEPGLVHPGPVATGFHAFVQISSETKQFHFSYNANFNGSGRFSFTPSGKTTTAQVSSRWPHPGFIGQMLPSRYKVTSEGFRAVWEIPYLSRNLPQYWSLGNKTVNFQKYTIGVKLFEPVFLYSMVTRAVKYGILFIGLTFIALLAFELSQKCRLHFVQYGLVGLAMSLFYLILLSFAEHIGFLMAYIAGSITCSVIIALYIKAALRNAGKGAIMLGILAGMYGLLYSLLRLEDYALMTGTVVLFVALIILMYLTRNLPVNETLPGHIRQSS